MYIITILQERCLRELEDELEEELEDEWEVDPELITQLITERLSKFKDLLPPQGAKPLDPTRCHARIWGSKEHKGEGSQCSHKIKQECLCGKHWNELCESGYLRFNRYDEERPIINEDGNPIPWNDGIESIDTIFRYQRMNLHKLLKQRKITPQ